MMNRFELLKKGWIEYRCNHLGNVSAYKTALLGVKSYPNIAKELEKLGDCLPQLRIDRLDSMPNNSLGKRLAQHMQSQGLKPLHISPHVASELADYRLGLRYTLLHDTFHVLLGYDTSLVGEYGVWVFVAAQQYSPQYEKAAQWGSIFYRCLKPTQIQRFTAVAMRSRHLAKQSSCLITQPIEKYWQDPLDVVQARLGLPS